MADNLELAARIRAARNYARIKQKDMAKKLSVSIETYGRIEAGTRPASDEELAIISEACTPEVPPWFIRQGWLGGITNPETMAGIFRRQGDENRVPSTMEARNAEGESLGIVDLKLLAAEERIYEEIARQVEARLPTPVAVSCESPGFGWGSRASGRLGTNEGPRHVSAGGLRSGAALSQGSAQDGAAAALVIGTLGLPQRVGVEQHVRLIRRWGRQRVDGLHEPGHAVTPGAAGEHERRPHVPCLRALDQRPVVQRGRARHWVTPQPAGGEEHERRDPREEHGISPPRRSGRSTPPPTSPPPPPPPPGRPCPGRPSRPGG